MQASKPDLIGQPDAVKPGSQTAATDDVHIGIVGAGLAGLRCADVLLQHGFRVTMIEGRDRVGGRVHQEVLPNGYMADMGPNWIHGTEDNPIYELVKALSVETGNPDAHSHVFDDKGRLMDVAEGEKYTTVMWDIVQEAFKYSNDHGDETDDKKSLHDFFAEKVAQKIPETADNWHSQRQIVMQLAESWGAFVGSPVTRQSLKFFWLEECIDGENLFCADTYDKILKAVAERARSEADIKLGTVASKITYRTSPGDRVRVDTSDGQRLEFDHVVVTSPLGWLKQHLDAFQPPLPPRLTQAIGSIGYGSLEKVYISFPEAFWKSEGGMQGFVQWLSPGYAADSNPHRWNQEVVELASFGAETSHPTLLFYTYGEQSAYITSQLASMADREGKKRFMLAYFKPYYSRLPGWRETELRCQPESCWATDWLHDELAGNGSYCNFQVGLKEGDVDIETMRHGLPDQGLWLAGEHTAPFVALGTATGAYWSGESVGKRIIASYSAEQQGVRDAAEV